jgi:GMP synthase (glutamine-hydrolysing)
MSHSDTVGALPLGCKVLAANQHGTPVSLMWDAGFYGIQFHPEVTHSHDGMRILHNFLLQAKRLGQFRIDYLKREIIDGIRMVVGQRQVVCGVSGGVDSTVLAVLLHEAGVNMRAIFVDHGLMRKDEGEEVRNNFHRMGVPIETVDAADRFLVALEGVEDPEKKRAIIGNLFIDVFWDAVGDAELLAQGTLYPDVIESASNAKSKASKIKTHHNRVDPARSPASASVSGARSGCALPGGRHARAASHHPRVRCHLYWQAQGARLVRPRLAGLCRSCAGENGGCERRRAQLRMGRGAARGGFR